VFVAVAALGNVVAPVMVAALGNWNAAVAVV
jgi:hypothetical protein